MNEPDFLRNPLFAKRLGNTVPKKKNEFRVIDFKKVPKMKVARDGLGQNLLMKAANFIATRGVKTNKLYSHNELEQMVGSIR